LFDLLHTASKISLLILVLKYLFLCRICRCAGREAATRLDEEASRHLSDKTHTRVE